MKTFIITKSDIDDHGLYTGALNAAEVIDGHLVIEADLGRVLFKGSLRVKGGITAKAGTSIEAGLSIISGGSIKSGGNIIADRDIKAGTYIEAGGDITAKTISSRLRIFAGVATRKHPEPEEMQVRAKQLQAKDHGQSNETQRFMLGGADSYGD